MIVLVFGENQMKLILKYGDQESRMDETELRTILQLSGLPYFIEDQGVTVIGYKEDIYFRVTKEVN